MEQIGKINILTYCQWLLRNYRVLLLICSLAIIHVTAQNFTRSTRSKTSEFSSALVRPAPSHPAAWVPKCFKAWRQLFLTKAQKFDRSGLVAGIFLGSPNSISSANYALFHQAGLLHILAASGFNCWIVAALFFFGAGSILDFFFTHSQFFYFSSKLYLALKERLLHFCYLLGGGFFYLWSDQSPPITRAYLLILTRFLFWQFGQQSHFLRILIAHYALSLLLAPRLWFSASFQLTYACIAGMHFAGVIRKRVFSRSFPGLEYLTLTIGASLGATPVTLFYFGEANFTGVFTNLLSGPLISFAIMPLSLLAMLLVNTSLAEPLLWTAGWLAQLLIQLTRSTLDFAPTLQYFY